MLRLLLFLLLPAALAAAQEDLGRPYWVSTPPRAAGALNRAREAASNRDWGTAAKALQEVCDEFPDSLTNYSRGRYVGTRKWALELLSSMPSGVREEHERLYGRPARALLNKALASDDRDALLDVVRRFEATRAGLLAILALADRALLHGQPAEARLLLARIPNLHPEAAIRPEVQQRTALAAARDQSEGGPAPTAAERAAPLPRFPAHMAEAWPMLGGNARRTAVAPDLVFREAQYILPYEISERLLDDPPLPNYGNPMGMRSLDRETWKMHWREFNPVRPVIARGMLVYHDGSRVVATNLYDSEEERWRYPRDADSALRGRTNLSSIFSPVVADGIVYAAVEMERPFVPQQLQGVPITYYLPVRRLVAVRLETGEPVWEHDMPFDPVGTSEDLLARLSVVGPPLVRGDRLYVPACLSEGTFHTYLLAIDRHTGERIYATRISIGQQELNLFGRQLQESAASPIAEADGVLYYGTNLGIVVAVDALLGSPLWLTAYPIVRIEKTYRWFEAPRRWPLIDNQTPMVSGDLLLVAPSDGRDILCLDRRSGRMRWTLPYDSVHSLGFTVSSLQAVDEERIYVGGEGGVAALWLRDDAAGSHSAGEIAWKHIFSDGGDPGTGQGVLATNGLWIPTERCVYAFEPQSGLAIGRYERSDEDVDMHAHLTWGDGVLLVSGRDFLSARFDESEVVKLAKARIASRPGEVAPVLAAADVYRAVGPVSTAIERYRDAIRMATAQGIPAAATRGQDGLHRALLLRAQQSLDEARERAAGEFESAFREAPDDQTRLYARVRLERELAERDRAEEREWRLRNLTAVDQRLGALPLQPGGPLARGWALRRMAATLMRLHQPRQAIAVLQRLLESDPNGPDGLHANREIREILATEGRAIYESYEKRAARLFEAAFRGNDLQAVELGLRIYSNTAAAEAATLQLAERRIEADNATDAARILQQFLVERPRSVRVPDALFLMARAYHQRRAYGPAYSALHRLKTRHGEVRMRREDGAMLPASDIADEWLTREPYVSLSAGARDRRLGSDLVGIFERRFPEVAFVDVPELMGQRPEALRNAVLLRAGTRVIVLDTGPEKTRELYRLEFDDEEPQGPLVMVGDRLLAVSERHIHLFEASTGRVLKRPPVPDGARGLQLIEHQGQVFLLYRMRGRERRVGVAALYPEDASILWKTVVPTSRRDERVHAHYTVAQSDHLLLFSEHPVRVTSINATSGVIENRITIDSGRNSRIALLPRALMDGRLLLCLGMSEKTRDHIWEHSYLLFQIDPTLPGKSALLWRYRPPRDEESRYPRLLRVIGRNAVVLDETRGAAVVDLRDGSQVQWSPRLPVDPIVDQEHNLARTQPRQGSALLVLTSAMGNVPAKLSAYELPDLRRRYSIEVADDARQEANVVDADGLLGISLRPRDSAGAAPRIRIFDPNQARILQEIAPAAGPMPYFVARVQNGVLILTTPNRQVLGFAPRDRK